MGERQQVRLAGDRHSNLVVDHQAPPPLCGMKGTHASVLILDLSARLVRPGMSDLSKGLFNGEGCFLARRDPFRNGEESDPKLSEASLDCEASDPRLSARLSQW